MNWTPAQKKILKDRALARVVYKNIFKKYHQLGYTTGKGNRFYDIVVAKDCPSREVRNITLLHECGHIYYLHNEINLKEEYNIIKGICEKSGKSISCLSIYGGIREFINIVTDIEVNEKALTKDNFDTMKDFGFEICSAEQFGIPVMDNYRDYYEPLLNKIDNKTAKELEQYEQMVQSILQDMMQDLPNLKGKLSDGKSNDKNSEKSSKGKESKEESDESKGSKDGTGDKELDELLEQDKDYGKDNVGEEEGDEITNVNNIMDEGDGIGSDSNSGNSIDIGTTSRNEIKKFLTSLIKQDMKVAPDAFKLYNRKSRGNSNLLYTSMKRKIRMDRPKMVIITDVSGSMPVSNVIQAVRSIKDIVDYLDPNSKLVTWNTSKVEEFPLNKVPNNIRTGGGTAIEDGVEYAIKNKFTDIVIYSDLETDIGKINKLVEKNKVNLYTIRVGKKTRDYEGMEMKEYYKNNKKIIEIEG